MGRRAMGRAASGNRPDPGGALTAGWSRAEVHNVRRSAKLLAAGITWLVLMAAGASAAAASDNVGYNGGPVAHSMSGVLVDWGSAVNPMYTNETSGDPGLLKYLSAQSGSPGDIGGVLAQYMDSSGHNAANQVSYAQQFQIAPSVTSSTIYDSQIQTELVNQIDAGHLPHPAGDGLGTIYLVLFPSGDVECIDSSTCSANAPNQTTAQFCAYHSGTTLPDGTNVLYAVLPDDTSGPMSYECGQAPTVFDDQTSYLSHEWSETITDPLGNAWWVTDSTSSDYGNEVGDNCNQLMATEGGWTVQQEWSNLDGNCMASEPAYSAPTASFVAPSAAAPGQPVAFDASGSSDPAANQTAIAGTSYSIGSGITSYGWNWGDGSTSTTTTPTASHTYAALGNYQVSLTVTDNLGFQSTVTRSVAVTATGMPAPQATTGGAGGVSDAGATLEGTVNPEDQPVQYRFVYGTSAGSLADSTPLATGPLGQSPTAVSATVTGLAPSTTYYYELQVVSAGQTYAGSVQSFTTGATPPPPQTPSAATGGASQVSPGGAIVAGTVDPGGSQSVAYDFAYGTSPSSLTSTTPAAGGLAGTTSAPVTAALDGLDSHTTYYFRLEVTLDGQTYAGTVRSFTTTTPAPGAVTGGATAVGAGAATVLGAVQANGAPTRYLVEFGPSTAYGYSSAAFSAGAGTASLPVRVTLSGLRPRTRYHYRLVAISAGGTAVGADRTFTTARALGPPPRLRFAIRSPAALRAALAGRLEVRFRCSRACVARFTVSVAAPRIARLTPVTVTLARAWGRGGRWRWATARLRFGPAVRRRLLGRGRLRLVVLGYAVSPGSARSAPRAQTLILAPRG
jgi:PKD repeat protein